jgi:hypothetical protein
MERTAVNEVKELIAYLGTVGLACYIIVIITIFGNHFGDD